MATKKNAAPSKPATAKTAAPAKPVPVEKVAAPAATPAAKKAAPAKKAAVKKPTVKPAVKKTTAKPAATKSVVSPATTKAIETGAVAVKSLGDTPTTKPATRKRVFKSLGNGATAVTTTKIDPPAAAAETKPAAKPVRRTFKATVTAGLKKKAEDLIAEAKAAGLVLCIVTEGGKPGVKLYPIAN